MNACKRIEHVDPNDPAQVSAFEMLWAESEGQRRTRAADMPTEQRAIRHLFDAWYRLKELGWREAMYAPRDRTWCEFIECGSTGVYKGYCDEEGRIWLVDDQDTWPSNAVLFKQVPQ